MTDHTLSKDCACGPTVEHVSSSDPYNAAKNEGFEAGVEQVIEALEEYAEEPYEDERDEDREAYLRDAVKHLRQGFSGENAEADPLDPNRPEVAFALVLDAQSDPDAAVLGEWVDLVELCLQQTGLRLIPDTAEDVADTAAAKAAETPPRTCGQTDPPCDFKPCDDPTHPGPHHWRDADGWHECDGPAVKVDVEGTIDAVLRTHHSRGLIAPGVGQWPVVTCTCGWRDNSGVLDMVDEAAIFRGHLVAALFSIFEHLHARGAASVLRRRVHDHPPDRYCPERVLEWVGGEWLRLSRLTPAALRSNAVLRGACLTDDGASRADG